MFKNLFQRPAPLIIEKEVPSGTGFFNTDLDPLQLMRDVHARTQHGLQRAIQRSGKDFVMRPNGGADAMAMDSAISDAMDSAIGANQMVNAGATIPLMQFDYFAANSFIGWQMCGILAQHWLIDKACRMPADDAIRHGWEIGVNDGLDLDPQAFALISRLDKRYKIKRQAREFVRFCRIFGIRHGLYLVTSADPDYYEKPFNPDGVTPGSYKGISQIDPYWMSPELDRTAAANIAAPNFYEPTWWRVNGKRIHHTHFCIIKQVGDLPDILKPTYYYGGIPIPQKIAERVYASEKVANEAPMLAMTKRLFALKMDMTKKAANPEAITAKMQAWMAYMNNYGVKLHGVEEEIQQYDTSLTGFDETVMTQYQLVSAASEVPATKLLGTSPKGFNATGEYDEKSYHEGLESIQEHDISPLLEGHYIRLIRSEIAPRLGVKPFDITINWNPVDSPSAEQVATINKTKSETAKNWADVGAIDGTDARSQLIKDKESGYYGLPEVVPGGPGDREAEREMEEALLNAKRDGDGDGQTNDVGRERETA